MGVWGLCSRKNFQKLNLEIAYFSSFMQAEMVSSVLFFSCSFGEARLSNRCKPILAIAQSCNIVDTFLGRAPGRAVSGAKPPEAESFFLFLDIPREEPFFTSLQNFINFVNHTYSN